MLKLFSSRVIFVNPSTEAVEKGELEQSMGGLHKLVCGGR
jgi:hypothetical protein